MRNLLERGARSYQHNNKRGKKEESHTGWRGKKTQKI